MPGKTSVKVTVLDKDGNPKQGRHAKEDTRGKKTRPTKRLEDIARGADGELEPPRDDKDLIPPYTRVPLRGGAAYSAP
jgi:hypothetical protein